MRREKSPNVLCFSFPELVELDTVKVELLPEKKGLILKHVEYEVTSEVRAIKRTVNPPPYDIILDLPKLTAIADNKVKMTQPFTKWQNLRLVQIESICRRQNKCC